MNLAYVRTAYQYYDGFAYQSSFNGENIDYSERKKYIEQNLNNAINRLDRRGNTNNASILDTYFIKKLYKLAKESFVKEKHLYNYLEYKISLNLPTFSQDLNVQSLIGTIDNYLQQIEKVLSPLLKKSFSGISCDKLGSEKALQFVSVLSSQEFQHRIAGHKTILSFTDYGNSLNKNISIGRARTIGKKELSEAPASLASLSRRGKKSLSAYKSRLEKFISFISNDFISSYQEELSVSPIDESKLAEIIKSEIEIQIERFADSLGTKMYIGRGKNRRIKDIKSLTSSIVQSAKRSDYEIKLKNFYKNLYREIIKKLNSKSNNKQFGYNKSFLGGALQLHESFYGSVWSTNITFEVYEHDDMMESYGERKEYDKRVILEKVLIVIRDILQQIASGNSENSLLAKEGITYFNKNWNYCLERLMAATVGISKEQFPSWIGAFAPQKVAGLVAELVRSILTDNKLNPIIVGADTDNEGGQLPVDIKLEVIAKNNRRIPIGIQIKNYTTAEKSITLYQGKEVDVFGSYYYTYLNQQDGRLLRYILANEEFIGSKNIYTITKDQYIAFLNNFIAEFMRYKDFNFNEKRYKNNFYILNDAIVPTSYIFLLIIKKALQTVQQGSKIQLFDLISKSSIKYETILWKQEPISIKTQNIDPEQKARKTTPNGIVYKKKINPLMISEDNNTYYPLHVDLNANSFTGKKIIKFKGIKINISNFF